MTNSYKVVVDGSNIATEGRTLPSLSQLDEAVTAFIEEHPGADVLVIVDSSFPNRIDPKELQIFESAYAAGEIITPPAGTIGRGDAFILKVADKLGATILSNDSFQEFHGTYDWLFDKGRLIGGKPLPGLGWVFMPRTPVRGVKSREAVREAKRSTARIGSPEAMKPMPVPKGPPPVKPARVEQEDRVALNDDVRDRDGRRKKRRKRGRNVREDGVVDEGREPREPREPRDAREPRESRESRESREPRNSRGERSGKFEKRERREGSMEPINEPLTFINFIAAHLIGSEVEGEVESYSSHGFYVTAAGARAYVPLAGLAIPMPRSAKEVVRRGEMHSFVVCSFDTARRGIELALVGTPAAEELGEIAEPAPAGKRGAGKGKSKPSDKGKASEKSKAEKPTKADKLDRLDKPDKLDKSGKPDKLDKSGKPDKAKADAKTKSGTKVKTGPKGKQTKADSKLDSKTDSKERLEAKVKPVKVKPDAKAKTEAKVALSEALPLKPVKVDKPKAAKPKPEKTAKPAKAAKATKSPAKTSASKSVVITTETPKSAAKPKAAPKPWPSTVATKEVVASNPVKKIAKAAATTATKPVAVVKAAEPEKKASKSSAPAAQTKKASAAKPAKATKATVKKSAKPK